MIVTNKTNYDKERPHNKARLTMRNNLSKIAGLTVVFILMLCMHSFAQSESPVGIEFDKDSERIDIKTGSKLPDYKEAKRGSIQFFFGRLDTPEKGFYYFFDGRGFQDIKSLALIRKMPRLGAWAIVGSRGWRGVENPTVRTNPLTVCEIGHHAVSFIPINPVTEKPDRRVHVLLDDLSGIQWREIDHWVATMDQKEFDDAQGTFY